MKTKVAFLSVLIQSLFYVQAQDPLFLNSNQSLVYLNPSFAGSNGLIRTQAQTRAQWPALSMPYLTNYIGVDAYIKPIKGGIAINYMRDDAARGTVKNDVFSLSYAQYFSFLDNKLKIIPSLQGSFVNRVLDKTKLSFGDIVDPRLGQVWDNSSALGTGPTQRKSNFDISSGILVNYEKFYFGASIFHVNQPNLGLLGHYAWPARLSIYSSYNFKVNERSLLQMILRYEMQKAPYLSANVNALIAGHLILGAGYGLSDLHTKDYGTIRSTVANVNLGVRTNFFTWSFGYDVGRLGQDYPGSYIGSWESQLTFNLRNRENRREITSFETW